MKCLLLLWLIVLCVVPLNGLLAETHQMSMGYVVGECNDGYIAADTDVEFHIRLTNDGTPNCKFCGSMAFVVYSTGADWDTTEFYSDTVAIDSVWYPPWGQYVHFAVGIESLFENLFWEDWGGADTVGFAGIVTTSKPGIYEGLDTTLFIIKVHPDQWSVGDTICIDTVNLYDVYNWEQRWLGLGLDSYHTCNTDSLVPDWRGPYCFEIVDCDIRPELSYIDPDCGSVLGGEIITIYGTGFDQSEAWVHFDLYGGEEPVPASSIWSDRLEVETPYGWELGPVDVWVTNGSESGPASDTLTFYYEPPDSVLYWGNVTVYDTLLTYIPTMTVNYEPLPHFKFDILSAFGGDTTILKENVCTDADGYYEDSAAGTAGTVFFRFSSDQTDLLFNVKAYTPGWPTAWTQEARWCVDITGSWDWEDENVIFEADRPELADDPEFYKLMKIMRDMWTTDSLIHPFEIDRTVPACYDSDTLADSLACWLANGGNPYIYLNRDLWEFRSVCHELGHQLHYQLMDGDTSDWVGQDTYPEHWPSMVSDTNYAFIEGFATFIHVMSALSDFFYCTHYGDPSMTHETNTWWRGDADTNQHGEIVEGAVASMLLDIYDDDTRPFKKTTADDDDDVQEPESMLGIMLSSMDYFADSTQKTVNFPLFADRLMHTEGGDWQDDPVFIDNRENICQIFDTHHYTAPCGFCNFNGMDDESSENILPTRFAVAQNYPNPFNNGTRIAFSVPITGDYQISVYNILGRVVYTKRLPGLQAGEHMFEIGDDILGAAASGVYFYRVSSETETITRKMVLMK